MKYKILCRHILIIAVLGIYIFINYSVLKTCFYRYITGFPCPGCGLARAFSSLFSFDLKMAFYYHPLFFIAPLLLFIAIHKDTAIISNISNRVKNAVLYVGTAMFTIVYLVRLIFYNIP